MLLSNCCCREFSAISWLYLCVCFLPLSLSNSGCVSILFRWACFWKVFVLPILLVWVSSGEICKTERIKHTLGSCHSAKPKFWLSSPHRSAAVTQKSVSQFKPSLYLKSYTTNLKSTSGQRQNCPHEQGSYAYSLRVVIQGSVLVSCHWVLLLATKAMLEQFQMSCFGG